MFILQHSSEFYGRQYPEYEEYFDTLPGDAWDAAFLGFVEVALTNQEPPQRMIEEFIYACLACPQHILDNEGKDIKCILNRLLYAGARFPYHIVFARRYNGEETLEDEIQDYAVRGWLIDYMCKRQPFDASQFGEWASIEATYWMDLDYMAPADEMDRLACLKWFSSYLRSIA
jgi:hypothetical protein